ncbi:MAG: J domain-containing protein [Planctomycetota bacterium]|nr:MAG: J domain-containing protein [Planctomycetota bacterium]
MDIPDYYSALGVSESASPDEIKRAFRALAKQYHPDSYVGDDPSGAEQRFKRASEAYEVLSDPERRKTYDQIRRGGFDSRGHGGQRGAPTGSTRTMSPEEFEEIFGRGGFSDFFASAFGESFARQAGKRSRTHARYRTRGADIEAVLTIPVRDVFQPGKRSFQIAGSKPCESCGGVGFLDNGHVCPACAGIGHTRVMKSVEIKLPSELRDGQVMRLRGLGEPGSAGAPAGDLLLTIRIEDDDKFRVLGDDIEADLPVTPWEAALGAEVAVTAPDGTRLSVKVPAGTRSGARLRVRGKGLYTSDKGRGDLYLRISLTMPEHLTDRQRDLLRQLAESDSQPISGGARMPGAWA